MQTILIIGTIVTLCLLIIKNKIKLNMITLFLILFISFSLYHLTFIFNPANISYIQFKNNLELTEVWQNFSNQEIINDIQVSRTLSTYKSQSEVILKPNTVVHDLEHIYSTSENKVIKTRVEPLRVENELSFMGQKFKPLNLFVTRRNLVVVGSVEEKTRAYIYDKNTLEEIKNIEMNAVYITSRIIDEELFLVTSKMIDTMEKTRIRPVYKVKGKEYIVPYQNIYYIENTYPNNYVNILKTNLTVEDEANVITYLGLGQTIYFSNDALYLAEERYQKEEQSNQTILIKITDELKLEGLQAVRGYVLDQFSLGEESGYLRVATTSRDDSSSSNLYILDKRMRIVGSLKNFSKGNEIQAATFIGDLAYIETFNILDPFYVIDLSNVRNPKIISELKFDGYNTNFIPYDKNHLIAFGLVLDDNKQSQGIKVSLYDVTNPRHVVIESSDTIMYSEYNSAYTEVLYNNQSLLLDKENEVLGFPITYWIKEETSVVSNYKQFFLVYDLKDQFLKRLGTISHYEKGQVNDVSDDIKRAVVVKGNLYTVSDLLMKENSLSDLHLMRKINLR